jgi:NAD(P)-dependent dehydrogenase (short-subunit alcohol dehydrogenase family)
MAAEGAAIVGFDACERFESTYHPGATVEDLQETARQVEALGAECLTAKVDARDLPAVQALAADVSQRFGRVDTLIVNHGIWTVAENSWTLEESSWQESIDVLLTGAWKVSKAFVPEMLKAANGGSVILTSSVFGLAAQPSGLAYTVAKHGILGLMKTLAWELAEDRIRVNALLPGAIDTPIQEGGAKEKAAEWWPRFFTTSRSLLPIFRIEPEAVAKAAVFLASDDAAGITGVSLPIDAGWLAF